jgi:hypothetical protein
MRWLLISTAVFGLAVVYGISGCGSTAATKTAPSTPAVADHDPAGHADGDHAQDSAANANITAAFAKLPAEDKTLAEKQKFCPVSGELLGTMGVPIKIDVKGQPVFICCDGCKEKLLSTPDEYLAKLKK